MQRESNTERETCACPFCEEELTEEESPFCQVCKITILYCPSCQKPLSHGAELCSHCGVKIGD